MASKMSSISIEEFIRQNKGYADEFIEIPSDFDVHGDYLKTISKAEFVKAFTEYRNLFYQIQTDMLKSLESYGFVALGQKDGSRKLTEQRIWCMRDLIYNLCKFSSLHDSSLLVDMTDWEQKSKRLQGKLIGKLIEFGFVFDGYDPKKSVKQISALNVSYPSNPHIIDVMYAFAHAYFSSSSYEFDYQNFNYIIFSVPQNACIALSDMYVFRNLSKGVQEFILAFDAEMNKIGLSFGDCPTNGYCWGNSQFAYSKGKSYLCRIYLRSGVPVVRLFLRTVDKYTEYIETLPQHLKAPFIDGHGKCNHCKEVCGHRKEYIVDGQAYEKCDGEVFHFHHVEVGDIPYFVELIKLSARIKG